MPAIETYLEQVESLAQDVVNACGTHVSAGNAGELSAEFLSLFDKGLPLSRYQENCG
jgi:hypothetical protein